MYRVLGFSLMALASATDPAVTVDCAADTNITINIAYTKPGVSLLHFKAGDCTADNVTYAQNSSTNAVEINMNMRDCGLRGKSRVTRGTLRTIQFENVADLQLGREDTLNSDRQLVFYSNSVNLTCSVKDSYTVNIEYGKIDADYTGDQIAGGEKKYSFDMRSTDSKFNATIPPSTRAGDTVYLSIESSDVDFSRYKFSVEDCTFSENNGTHDVTEYKLFDNTANDCKNNFLDFTMGYCAESNSYKLSHTVFTFDPTRENNYTLSCNLKLCDFDVVDSVAKCDRVEDNCNIPKVNATVEQIDVMVYEGKWGDWLDIKECPAGSFVCGLKTRMEKSDSTDGDDTAFNGVEMICCDRENKVEAEVMVNAGLWGGWSENKCDADHFVCSLDIQFVDDQGTGFTPGNDPPNDDFAMNGLKGECCNINSHSERIDVQFEEGVGTPKPYGEYKGSQACDPGYYVCGLQARMESDQGTDPVSGDDTAQNGLKMKCCNKHLW